MPETSLHIVLVEPEIHWNTGNAGRTCLAIGAQLHLVEPLGFSLEESAVRRAGLDYWAQVEPVVWPSMGALERQLCEMGEAFFFTARAGRPFWDVRFPPRSVLLFGRESMGFSLDVRLRHAERLVEIPIADPRVRALNVSSCVGIAAYEYLRQQRGGASSAIPGPERR